MGVIRRRFSIEGKYSEINSSTVDVLTIASSSLKVPFADLIGYGSSLKCGTSRHTNSVDLYSMQCSTWKSKGFIRAIIVLFG